MTKVLVLAVGGEGYALPLDSVQQVISGPRVTRLPSAHPGLLGLINVRGEIVPLFDLSKLTGGGAVASPDYAVLVATAAGPTALATDSMPVTTVVGEAVGSADRLGDRGVYMDGERLLVMLAVDELVAGSAVLPRAS